ncbi:MAG: hypothetical protein IKZ28_02835 [Clostridia bacterium]|nr:hypothetical protein [Clostridia bacterium]
MVELLKTTGAYSLLKREKEENTSSHAYLLIFNDGRNLRLALKTFAKVLFGADETEWLEGKEKKEKERISKLIDEENFCDCLFFPEDGKKLMVEDAIRILEESVLKPIEGDQKIFVLGDFAEANPQTQNKLLKVLEEPPKNVTFLLGATSVFPILPTVLSRTKKLEIMPFQDTQVMEALSRIYGRKYDFETLEICSATSSGNVGEAQKLLEGGHYKTLMDSAFSLLLEEEHKLPSLFRTVGETKYKKELLSMLRLIFRDGLVLKSGVEKSGRNLLLKLEKERVKKVAEKYSVEALLYAQEALSNAELQTQFNAVFSQCIGVCISKIRDKNR